MLIKCWIRIIISHYSKPVLFIRKKTSELKIYIAFCALNANIKLDVFSLPPIAGLLELGRIMYFCSIDLATTYN